MNALAAGMQEQSLIHEGGWAKIPETYFRTLGPEHIREVHRELSPVSRWGKPKKETDPRPKSGRGRL